MKALRVLFAILLSLVLFCLQTALLSLFVADRLVSPSALTTAIEGSGLVDSIVEDTLTDMGMDASAADPAPLNAYAGELVSGVVTALVRGGELPTVEAGELTTLLDGVTIRCVSGVGHPAYTVGVAMAGCEVTRTGATTATLTIGNEHFVWLYNNYAPEIGGIEHTLAPSSATSYTIELEYKNGAWALVDPADKGSVVFQVMCSTSGGEDKPDSDMEYFDFKKLIFRIGRSSWHM